MNKKDYSRFMLRQISVKRTLFIAFIVVMAFIGTIWFARPKTSAVEKRELTKFPKVTISGMWNGSFFSDVDTWYADTYPLREGLISIYHNLQSHYGVRTQQLIVSNDTVQTEDKDSEKKEGNKKSAESTTKPKKETDPDANLKEGLGDVTAKAEPVGTIYIAGGSGYGVYSYGEAGSKRYAQLVSRAAQNLKGTATVYNLIAPISAGIMLSDDVRESINCSDENKATEKMYSMMNPAVKTVSVYHALKKHNSEYIFFHTDHHWTSLGAYYSYREFCKVKGIKPNELSTFEKMQFPGFLGTFYAQSGQNSTLAANPDTVTAYVPKATNEMTTYFNTNGVYNKAQWRVVNDVSDYAKTELYACFAAGDQAFNYVHNEKKKDGSSILVVKDSYANAFIPFLVDHYEYVYWIDYRYYSAFAAAQGKPNAAISTLVKEKHIKDVLLLNNINFTGADSTLEKFDILYR